eukprot:CAMPEP_0117652276 /NCGR_PEP_ID=MMETSP0804-20121206/2541_1 /TAXON_ID=1074897 /ORGANISM="Tetraselmis astigmatica, Strain CCMP880" /LENGTH=380 /DNA_ID=CAMNT_0005458313 /DNA_START=47 /DNA_END=1190 /DNA_ORIENTATION=+
MHRKQTSSAWPSTIQLWSICQGIPTLIRVLAAQLPEASEGQQPAGYPNFNTSEAILWVWDGTAATPAQGELWRDEHWELEQWWAAEMPLAPVPGHRLVAATIPEHGTALPVQILYTRREELPFSPSGSLLSYPLKLRNVQVALDGAGRLYVHYHRYSRWARMPEGSVPQLDQQTIQKFDVDDYAPVGVSMVASQLVPPHPNHHFSSLRAIRCSASRGELGKFRCLVKVVGHWPDDVEQFCSPRRIEGAQEEWVWAVKLLLADTTGSVTALLWGPDAKKFFSGAGLQACDLSQNPEVLGSLRAAVQCLTGVTAAGEGLADDFVDDSCCQRERPSQTWIECCIASYFMDRERPVETATYKIFDTELWFPSTEAGAPPILRER